MIPTPHSQQGFTLIELMIVIAIIGILSAVAIPTYKNHTKKSEATVGISTCSAMLTNIELYIQEKGTYPTLLADIGASSTMSPLGALSLTQNASNTETGTLLFTFGTKSSLNGQKIKYSKSTDSGWTCVQNAYDGIKACPYTATISE